MTDSNASAPLDGIAIVGIAGRFPGSRDCDEFWQNLRAGREGITFFTDEEIEDAGYNLGANRGSRVRSRGVVDEADYFDAAFFGYTPREAEIMDPQQRVFLEVAWAALESAGFDPDRVPGAVGVYAGASINTYYPNNVVTRPDILGPFGVFPAVALNEKDFLATRLAYKLNLRGPAVSVQTACSTSLVAVCNAAQSLLSFECDIALAGGVAINYPHCHSIIHEDGGMISADGHCKPFDKDATGTLFSDGAGVVALRRLEDAVESGDTILAVIKGYALNNDGSDKAGFTAPSINGQSEVIQMAQAFADIEPDTISYIEAHGTATPLGDPIEIAGLTQAFQTRTDATQFCALGSVKSNLGHLDVAAGIAGFIKTVLMLHHKEIPPTIHYTAPNAMIDFASTPFFVADKLQDWIPPEGIPRRAGISSFGIGGTNAHVILEEAPQLQASGTSRSHQLLPVSARTKEAVAAASNNLAKYVGDSDVALADVAFTLQAGRYQFNQRAFAVCADGKEAAEKLSGGELPILVPGRHNPPVVFMFPGQGSQRVNMGRDLYESEQLYRETIDSCAEILQSELDLDLRNVLFPAKGKEAWAEEQIVQTRITQPALFVTEYALAQLWMSWGVHPDSMIGHSVGEYVAACLAEVFSLEDGLRLIAARGRLIQEQPTGTMLAVMAGEEAVQPLLVNGVTIATINAATLCVVSGSHDNIAAMEAALANAKMEFRPLHTSHAFHSEMMEPVVEPFTKLLKSVQMSAPTLPFVSNLTGQWITNEEATGPDYWAQHMRQAVRFADGASVLMEHHDQQVLLEVGPGATLTSLTRMNSAKQPGHVTVPSLASALPGEQSEIAIALGSLGRIWQAGVDIDWEGFYSDETRRRVPLPTYPFERKRHFIEPGNIEFAQPSLGSDHAHEATTEVPASKASDDIETQVVDRLYNCLEAVSGLTKDEMGINTSFLEMGFDSLLLSRVCSVIDVEFGVAITFRKVAEDLSTISKLAEHLESASADTNNKNNEVKAMDTSTKVDETNNADQFIPLLDAQREIWLAAQVGDDVSRTYNEARLINVNGALDVDVLRDSLQAIIDRHHALRATCAQDGSGQSIAGHIQLDLPVETIENESDLEEAVHAVTTTVFDLDTGPMFRFQLYDLGEGQWAILLVIHHLVADGWSWALILQELGAIYSSKATGNPMPDASRVTFVDYVSWCEMPAHAERESAAEKYWLEMLDDKPAEIELPSDRPRPPEKTFVSGRYRHQVNPALLKKLKAIARQKNCTVFHLLTASFSAWMYRITAQSDLVIGVPTAGQAACGVGELGDVDRLVGHCVNMLPVRLTCDGTAPFEAFLEHTKDRLFDARDHQDISFGDLITKLKWPRDPSRIPLASVSLNYAHAHQVHFAGLDVSTDIPSKAYSFFDLTVDMIEGDTQLEADCKFNLDLFDQGTVERWFVQWECMLDDILDRPERRISDISLLSPNERQHLLQDWNATAHEFEREACLHDVLAAQAAQSTDKLAATSGGLSLSYSELQQRANQVARTLRDRGVQRGQHVGICVERSVDMLAVAIGILKAGAAYVPLDPSFPEERLQFMADDAELALLVSTTALAKLFEQPREQLLLLDDDAALIEAQSQEALTADAALDAQPEDAAYMIYTSGSTGKPKGVVVPHRAVVNFLTSMAREPGLTSDDVLVAVTTLSFDIAVLELYLPLMVGATVVIASYEEAIDGAALKGLLETNNATVMQATPVSWRLLLEAEWRGNATFKALVGGEALPLDLADQLIATDVALWNMYGPTETTVWSTCCHVTDTSDGITIGKPIDNTTIYILDEQKNLCPIGVPGELYIGGDGVTHGYWKRPELTADRFIADPFADTDAAIMYGTGDKARWLNDGTLQHLGRFDDQIKVRGFRIEAGEIEAGIAKHPKVNEVTVVAREDIPGDQRLVAYMVCASETENLEQQIREQLREHLPDYMIPAHYVQLDEMPRTNNGKINRNALPAFDMSPKSRQTEIAPPENATEESLVSIWTEVLGIKELGIDDDFFELGGHSLLAMQVVSRVREAFSSELALRDIFVSPTIRALALHISNSNDGSPKTGAIDDDALRAGSSRPAELAGEREEFVL